MRQVSSTTAHAHARTKGILGSFILFSLFVAAACATTPGAVGVPDMQAAAPAAALATPQADAFSGTWTAEVKKEKADDRIQFSFTRRSDGGHSNHGNEYALADFQGLTREQVRAAANKPVNFRLVREAGTLECEGSFRDGRGSGTWRLVPSQAFRSAMSSRGYDLTDEQMFTATMIDVRTSFVDDLKTMGFDRLDFDDVVKATIFKVTPEFVAELRSLGFENLGLEELVKARIFKVDAAFAREVREMGFDEKSMEQLVKLRIFKVTPAFLKEIKDEGLKLDSIEDAVKLRIFKVDADFIRRARASGHTDLDVEQLVKLRIHKRVD
ncbi:MAG TPA: hypothetical protein VD861_12605 [Pyrinomonadaceae bacterium]|nr:hypothetical protein [Pyrinomonadaceae bacterium]